MGQAALPQGRGGGRADSMGKQHGNFRFKAVGKWRRGEVSQSTLVISALAVAKPPRKAPQTEVVAKVGGI